MRTKSILMLLTVALGGCERESQELPFSTTDATTRVVGAAGGTVSSPAGAAIQVPAGALSTATTVTVTPLPPPAGVARSGTPVSTAFRVEPAGTELSRPATVQLQFEATRRDSAWLASVVNLTPTGVRERGDSRVDLSTGAVRAPISRLGTLVVVIPERRALFPVTRRSARQLAPAPLLELAASGTDSVRVNCGDPNNRCENLSVQASDNLMARVDQAALVYPLISGTLRVNGTQVAGRINLSGSVRAQLKSGATAENVDIVALIEPTTSSTFTETASEIAFSQMRYRVSGSADSGAGAFETVGPLVIPKTSGAPLITVTRTFRLGNETGVLEDASISVTFPVQIHQ